MERVSVFADVQNIYYTVKQNFNCHFNYSVFMSEVTHKRQLVKAIAYAIDKGDAKQIQFQKILEDIDREIYSYRTRIRIRKSDHLRITVLFFMFQ